MFRPKYLFFAAIAAVVLIPSLTLSGRLPAISWAHASQQPRASLPNASIAADGQTKAKKRTRLSRKEARTLKEKYTKKYGLNNQEQGS